MFECLWKESRRIVVSTVQFGFSDTFWSQQKLSLNHIMSLNRMILCRKLKNGLCKIVTESQVVTKFNVTKSRLYFIDYI